ncbi:hypothetical protein LguiA_000195 [Lonicera macranthoides]
MVGPSLNTHNLTLKPTATTIKFLCSYGGKILPRYPDGKLRYQGGETRLLTVDRSISFSELLVKLGELSGTSVSLRCQLPTLDLDSLVSITSDEDLINLMEEYDRAASLKIRAFLSLPKSTKKVSPSTSTSTASSSSTATLDAASPKSPSTSSYSATAGRSSFTSRCPIATTDRCIRPMSKPAGFPQKSAGKLPYYAHGNPSRIYLVHNGNHWQ